MDALPGSPQIQNVVPTTFFRTTTWAGPWLGVTGSVSIVVAGLAFLEWRRQTLPRGCGSAWLRRPAPPARAVVAAYGRGRSEPDVRIAIA